MKKISIFLIFIMILSMFPISVFADMTISNSNGEVPVILTNEVPNFSVTLPTVLPIDLDENQDVTVATDNKIINNSVGMVEVKAITVEPQNGWLLQDFNTNFYEKQVGIKEFGFQLNGNNVNTDGSVSIDNWSPIPAGSFESFTYDANVGIQVDILEDVEIAQTIFTVGWSSSNISTTAGLYDANGTLLCTWEESGINIEQDYTNLSSKQNSSSFGYIVNNYYPTTTKVVIPDNIEYIGTYAFYDCSNITSIVLGNNVSVIRSSAFQLCDNLKSVVFGNSLTTIGDWAFSKCYSLETIKLPNSVTSVGTRAFYECENVTSIDIPDSLIVIGDYAFSYIDGITSLVVPKGITTWNQGAFGECENLETVYFSDGATSIGYNSFNGCKKLVSVVIPKSVNKIETQAFFNTSSFNVYYKGTEDEWNAISKSTAGGGIGISSSRIVFNYIGQ